MGFRFNASARMALQYILVFGANGVSLPFIGLWLRAHGLDGAEIGVLLAAPMLGRLITGPAIALWADGFAHRRTAIAFLAATGTAAYVAMPLVHGFAGWAPLWFVATTCSGAIIPLSDVLTTRLATREGFAFSVPRGFGSAAFVAANVGVGALLVAAPVDTVIWWLIGAGVLLALWARFGLPAEPVLEGGPRAGLERFAGLGRLVRDPVFMAAIFAVGCVQASHAFYYGFSAILWKADGAPESLTGMLWGASVVVEIGFMWWIDPWRRRAGIGPLTMLALGAAGGVVRWGAFALEPPLWSLWPLQVLHTLTFAATFLAGVQLVERLSPPDSHTAAQTLSSMLSAGVLIGLATLASGPLFDRFGAGGYWAMAALAAVGGVVAIGLARFQRVTA
ncbi:major facilitator superfamily domain-containing protein 6 [soil metagenome]